MNTSLLDPIVNQKVSEMAEKLVGSEIIKLAGEVKEKINGTIFGRVKGGFSVDLDGAIAFLPGSQVDVRPTRDSHHLVGSTQLFHIQMGLDLPMLRQ